MPATENTKDLVLSPHSCSNRVMDIPYRALSPGEFPAQLREIPQPPKTLFLAGSLPPQETILLTVVGARKHSPYGREACEELISGLAGYDIAIISGLALGIDGIAHEAALAAGLRTIAVPGSGLDVDVLYPRSHVALARRILDHGGALLSEYADTKAATWTFPERNRIMAGLAKATLVIEAEEQSGTLITARMATDYNRDVFAVPGSIFSPLSAGPNKLISLGAAPIRSAADILHALGFTEHDPMDSQLSFDWSGMTESEQQVMAALTAPKRRDLLIEELGLSVSVGNILLMKMEIAGYIKDTPNGLRRS